MPRQFALPPTFPLRLIARDPAAAGRLEVRLDGSFTIFCEEGTLAPVFPDAEIARKAAA
jgi:hypothetical protein